jgi:DNA-binding MarR family transcriptional regulator
MYDPGKTPEAGVLATINEIPKAFFRLTATAERLHADLGVGAPARGLLRDLFVDGGQTAPDLASKKSVTRQAIQPLLDELVARGFVTAEENPRHKRSKLYVITPDGIELCVKMQEREIAEIRRLLPNANGADFDAAAKAIRTLSDMLQAQLDETS